MAVFYQNEEIASTNYRARIGCIKVAPEFPCNLTDTILVSAFLSDTLILYCPFSYPHSAGWRVTVRSSFYGFGEYHSMDMERGAREFQIKKKQK